MIFDYVSDLHWDNCMGGGPHGWFSTIDVAPLMAGGEILLVAGDTGEHMRDVADFLNKAAQYYRFVVAIPGNHETGAAGSLEPNVRVLRNETLILREAAIYGGEMPKVGHDDLESIRECWRQHDRTIILSHYVPSSKIGGLVGFDLSEKTNGLVELLGDPQSRTEIVFGHAHINFDGAVDGYRCVSTPRGYRGVGRDGMPFKKFGSL